MSLTAMLFLSVVCCSVKMTRAQPVRAGLLATEDSSLVETHVRIQEPVERFGFSWHFSQTAFLERFREGVEQRPDIPLLEFRMARLTPFLKHFWDQAI